MNILTCYFNNSLVKFKSQLKNGIIKISKIFLFLGKKYRRSYQQSSPKDINILLTKNKYHTKNTLETLCNVYP